MPQGGLVILGGMGGVVKGAKTHPARTLREPPNPQLFCGPDTGLVFVVLGID